MAKTNSLKTGVGDKPTTRSKTIAGSEVELIVLPAGQYWPRFIGEKAAQADGWKNQIVPGLLSLSIAYGLLMQAGFLKDVMAYYGYKRHEVRRPGLPG